MKLRRPHLALALAFLTACGGSDGPTEPPPPTVASVTVGPDSPTIEVGQTQQFSATARDASGGSVSGLTVNWSTSNSAIATVTSTGLVTGVGIGTSAITATAAGVAGSQVLTVEADECQAALTVTLEPGQFQSYDATQCLMLPAGAAGDRYRVAVIRPTEVANSSDVSDISLDVTGIGTLSSVPAPVSKPAGLTAALPGIDGTRFVENMKLRETTRRFHNKLRRREMAMGWGPESLLPNKPTLASALLADPPSRIEVNQQLTCSGAKAPALLLGFNDDIAIYQDSVQNMTKAIPSAAAQQMIDYYTKYVKDMITQYWGELPDIDGNGRVVVTTSPALSDTVAAAVWSGDLTTSGSCPNGNQMELIYFSSDFFAGLGDANPNFAPLGTLAHETKHVVSLHNRIAASNKAGTAQFHPLWIEEGTAEISESMASRIAWAATGGPAVGAPITGDDIINTVRNNNNNATAEMWGVIDKLANIIVQLSTHPNSLITNPAGANAFHTFYAAGWHFHRFVGDAFGNASTPFADAPLFRQMTDSTAPMGSATLVQATGRSFDQLFEDLVVAMSLHGTSAPAPTRAFTTYDFVTATNIFGAPVELTPPGVYPWPVTTDSTTENPNASFATAAFTGKIGPSGISFYDFLSNGTGTGAQIEVTVDPPAKVIVTRIN
jgi:Bacterial Ig-like domain (group 2)